MKISGNGGVVQSSLATKRPLEPCKQTNQKMFLSSDAVKVEISKEGRECYQQSLKTSNNEEEPLNKIEIMMRQEFSFMIWESGGGVVPGDLAQKCFESYVKKYDQIVQGYDAGTMELCVRDDTSEKGYRLLTKEEALAKLTEEYETLADKIPDMEKRRHREGAMIQASREHLAGIQRSQSVEVPSEEFELLSQKMKIASSRFRESYNKKNIAALLEQIKVDISQEGSWDKGSLCL